MPPIIYPSHRDDGRRKLTRRNTPLSRLTQMTTGGNIFAYLEARAARPPQIHRLTLLSMPLEVVQMIVDETVKDTKSLQSIRATCKLLKQLSEKHFRQAHLTHLHVSPTREAFGRLLWTVHVYELAPNIQSITIPYHNETPKLSGALCAGMSASEGGDLFFQTLERLSLIRKRINLIVKVAETPLDGTCSVISILYRVLTYVLIFNSGRGVQKLFLDFDDTESNFLPVLRTSRRIRTMAEDFGPSFQRIWEQLLQLKTLTEVRIRFSKKDEQAHPDTARFMAMIRHDRGMHVGMQWLTTWHFDIMGRMNIFDQFYSLNIQNCAMVSSHQEHLFSNLRLQNLVLWNLSLHTVHRFLHPTTTAQTAEDWDYALTLIATGTALQSCTICFLRNSDGQILYPQPWILASTPERSVNQTLRLHYPS